jgi:hypothetical protein
MADGNLMSCDSGHVESCRVVYSSSASKVAPSANTADRGLATQLLLNKCALQSYVQTSHVGMLRSRLSGSFVWSLDACRLRFFAMYFSS